ncbi:MAG: methyltransferase domain-containing protein [Gammaproteobacteria bacterium SHHR-1]|uniref:class I SAM-dependent methyltransferase n=1 Tax=Magnetovirga frankeli TaxID=947516 RepID=UPI0012932C09|nr:methyltransferase domain-containing protein [gamma proteobacterium SS-5]
MPQQKPDIYPPASDEAAFWQGSACARDLIRQENKLLQKLDERLFGRFMLQLGGQQTGCPMPCFSGVRKQFVIQPQAQGTGDLRALPRQLPIASSSVNVFYLAHVLEFSDDPHALLREVDRTLIPGGRLLLSCFNPFGLYGLARLLGRDYPWSGRFIGRHRLLDWLNLLGFQVEMIEHLGYKPPLSNQLLHDRFSLLERLGPRLWPQMGAAFLVLAVKTEAPLSLLRPSWKKKRGFVPQGGIAEPTTRTDHHG